MSTAAAALRDLRRPVPHASATGVIGTLFMALPTFGLLPALLWTLRLHHMIVAEGKQYRNLAHWVCLHSRNPNAPRLEVAAARICPWSLLSGLVVCFCFTVAIFFGTAFSLGNAGLDLLTRATYGYRAYSTINRGLDPIQNLRHGLFVVWVGGLSLAYLAHWLQIQLHAQRVRRFFDLFSNLTIHEGLAPVFLPPMGVGLRPLWVLGAICCLACHAYWGVPMMLAGAAQRRYVCSSSATARAAAASRLRDLLVLGRPVPSVPVGPAMSLGSIPRLRCATQVCRLPLPAGARFCPRCGARAIAAVDRTA